MKKIIPIAFLSLSLVSSSAAAPFMAIGDGAELFITGALSIRSDDNVILSANAVDDVVYEIAPGFELTFGKDAQIKGALTANVAWANYADNSSLNSMLAGADFVARFDDGKMKLGFNTGFHELSQNTADVRPTAVGRLTRRNVFSIGGNGEVEISQLTSAGAGVAFNHEDYRKNRRLGYTNSDSFSVPLDFFYKWTPKVDVSAGYRFRDYDVDIGQDSTDHVFTVGARGDFSPKLTGRFNLGLGTRKLQRGGDESIFALDASFSYEISPKTSLQFGGSNDFGTSPQGAQQKNFSLRAALNSKLNEQWTLNGGVSYRGIDYGTRTDDYWEATLGASYIFDANISFLGGYTYRNYTSPAAGSDFTNNVFSIAANFRY
jgi:outer membrane receptor for ferrienterochelin and colicin